MRAVGIDLGTTNSVVAYVDDSGEAHAIADDLGNRILPSAVWFPADDPSRVEVGELAKRRRTIEPANVAALFKRGMGKPTFLTDDHDKPVTFVARGREWRPEVLSSIIVKKLIGVAETHLREKVDDVVITVPAYFGEVERAATRQAGELCGVTVHLLPAEPMAAAVAHGLDSSTGASTILVFDLGGGTFDVTVLRKDSVGQLTAIAHDGDRTLGGADFDKLIVERMVQQAMAELHTDLKANPNDYADAFRVAEELKFDLSTRQRAEATIIVGGQRMQFGLSRDDFQRMLAPHVEGTELTVESALDAAKMTRADIDVVLMVGGSSRIPAFQGMLHKYFDKTPLLSKNLDEDVARGAALMGALHLGTAPKGSALALLPAPRDVSSHPIGVTVVNDLGTLENCVVLDANSPIPSPEPVERRFGVAGDGQSQIQLTVNEGDDSNLRFVDELGSAMGTFDSPRPHGYPVDVRMAFTADGILTATAHDGESGRQIAVLTVERKGAMTKQDESTAMDLIRGLDVVDTSDAGVDDAQKPPTDDYEEI